MFVLANFIGCAGMTSQRSASEKARAEIDDAIRRAKIEEVKRITGDTVCVSCPDTTQFTYTVYAGGKMVHDPKDQFRIKPKQKKIAVRVLPEFYFGWNTYVRFSHAGKEGRWHYISANHLERGRFEVKNRHRGQVTSMTVEVKWVRNTNLAPAVPERCSSYAHATTISLSHEVKQKSIVDRQIRRQGLTRSKTKVKKGW